jgi:hypothetical protein
MARMGSLPGLTRRYITFVPYHIRWMRASREKPAAAYTSKYP